MEKPISDRQLDSYSKGIAKNGRALTSLAQQF